MTLGAVNEIIHGTVLAGAENLNREIDSAFASDLMSDVLAFITDDSVLITGLINPHVMRTAEMLDLPCIVFSRGKQPSEEMLEMAEEIGITVLSTPMTSYHVSGELYARGLCPTRTKDA